jgi:hypothetical protein
LICDFCILTIDDERPRHRHGKTKRCGCMWRAKAVTERNGEYLYFPVDDGYKILTHNHELHPEKPSSFPQHRRKMEDKELEALVESTLSGIEAIDPKDVKKAIKVLERRKGEAARRIDELGKEIDNFSAIIHGT